MLLFLVILAGLWSIAYLISSFRSRDQNSIDHRLPPGPPGLPVLGNLHMLGNLPHRSLHKLAKKYGPIMHIRLGLVPTIVVSSPQAAELFLKTHDITFAGRPKVQAVEYMSYGNKSMAFSTYGPYWREIRKLCTLELLTNSKIDAFQPMRKDELDRLVTLLSGSAKTRAVVDLSAEVALLIEEMTYRMIFGSSKDDRVHFKPIVQEVLRLAGAFNVADFVPYVGTLDLQGLSRRMKAVSMDFDTFLEKIIEEHAQDAIDRQGHHRDFIDVLLSLMESNAHGIQLDRTNIKAIILDMLAAAMDTSASAIEWALSELLRHPVVLKRAQEELESVVGMDRVVEETDLAKLDYLDMVVKESMRLHPIGALLLPHESMENVTINGYHIPKKSRVIINAWAIGRDPDAWSDNAEEFSPERFIGTNINVRGHDFQLIPFGSGRRGCPGMQLGLTVVQLVLAQLLHCFDWELQDGMLPGDLDMSEKFGLAVTRANHLLAIPTYRLRMKNI